jgi:cell division GTPase FtsZ
MHQQPTQGELWVVNTDSQVLAQHLCPNRMQIGIESTRGLGCGGNPEIGRLAAEESADGLAKVRHGGGGGGAGGAARPAAAAAAVALHCTPQRQHAWGPRACVLPADIRPLPP